MDYLIEFKMGKVPEGHASTTSYFPSVDANNVLILGYVTLNGESTHLKEKSRAPTLSYISLKHGFMAGVFHERSNCFPSETDIPSCFFFAL